MASGTDEDAARLDRVEDAVAADARGPEAVESAEQPFAALGFTRGQGLRHGQGLQHGFAHGTGQRV